MSRRHSPALFTLGCVTAAVIGSTSLGIAGGSGPAGPAGGAGRSIDPAHPVQLAASSCPSPGGATIKEAAAPKAAVTVFGHGWGHGMGMSQYGAQGAARLGCDYRTILSTYYHDSSVVTQNLSGHVLLNLAGAAPQSSLAAQTGPVQWAGASRSAVQPKGSTWSVVRRTVSGKAGLELVDRAGQTQLFIPDGSALTAHHSGVIVLINPTGGSALRTHWGSARFIGSPSGIAVTAVLSTTKRYTAVQKYLMGLAEVPISWPVEALKAQVVAARTYLTSKYNAGSQAYVVRITTADQVYRGSDQEMKDNALGGHWLQAVIGTAGQVIVDSSGRTIEAMYSSSSGGYTENRQYVYGHYGVSYLKAVDDSRWDDASDNPYRQWSKGFSKASLAQRFGFQSVSSWTVAQRGTAARLIGVRITGKRNGQTMTVAFTGTDARARLGLRSPGFTFGPASS